MAAPHTFTASLMKILFGALARSRILPRGLVGILFLWVQGIGADGPDQPCVRTSYPNFLELPAAAAVENLPAADPTGVGERWRKLIQTALRPNPKHFSWYREYGTWACRYQQTDLVVWQRFPEEANVHEIVGTLVKGRLLIAPVADLVVQGMTIDDPRPFTTSDLELAEKTSHPIAPR
jgi:hypothetical protein